MRFFSMLLLVGLALGGEKDRSRPLDENTIIFHGVLEGLFADGVADEDVDLILREDPETKFPMHFVQGCPLCLPTLDAIRTYRSRPEHFNRKGGNTFGPGLDVHLKKRLRSKEFKDRLDVVHTLIARWVGARVRMLRLTDDERESVRAMVVKGRKMGMNSLQNLQRAGAAGAYKASKGCAICDASNDPFK